MVQHFASGMTRRPGRFALARVKLGLHPRGLEEMSNVEDHPWQELLLTRLTRVRGSHCPLPEGEWS